MAKTLITQATVKAFCKAFGFKAKYSADYQEWTLTAPNGSTYYIYDNECGREDIVIYTMLEQYRELRPLTHLLFDDGKISESNTDNWPT